MVPYGICDKINYALGDSSITFTDEFIRLPMIVIA